MHTHTVPRTTERFRPAAPVWLLTAIPSPVAAARSRGDDRVGLMLPTTLAAPMLGVRRLDGGQETSESDLTAMILPDDSPK
jgi:hypothetical protein